MLDPFIVEFLMDDPCPLINEIVEAAGLTVQYNQNMINSKRSRKTTNNLEAPDLSYFNDLLHTCSDSDYEEKFHINKSTMKKLIDYVTAKLEEQNAEIDATQVSLDHKLHIFMFVLSTTQSFTECSKHFRIAKPVMLKIFNDICEILCQLKSDLIKFPDSEEQDLIKDNVRINCKFPNCVGFLDARHIRVDALKSNMSLVLLQAVCDYNLIFRDIFLAETGSKQTVFELSPLGRQIDNLIKPENHLLGDSSYNLEQTVLVPRQEKELTAAEQNYNFIHKETWGFITKAFNLFFKRFKKLKHLELNDKSKATNVIIAACVVHNFILLNELKVEQANKWPALRKDDLRFVGFDAGGKSILICDDLIK